MWISTEDHFKIEYFLGCTALGKFYPQQWDNINNAKAWCHTGNCSTIYSQKKVTQDKITEKSWRGKIGFDLECTWDIPNR